MGGENLLVETLVVEVVDLDDGGIDEPAPAVVVAAAEEVRLGVLLRVVDVFGGLVVGVAVDDGAHEDAEIAGVSDPDGGDLGQELLLYLGPEGGGNVGAGQGGALLALVFKGAADQAGDQLVDVGVFRREAVVPAAGKTVLDIDFANVNPVIHVPATILGVSTMENWGVIFCGHDRTTYSMYSHGLCPSICETQYAFYNEEIALAEAIGVGIPKYKKQMFFSRRSVLTQEYMGLDKDGNDNVVFPLDAPSNEGNTGPNSIHHRYLTEDVPIGCKIYHDLGVQYGVPTPIIDSMITLAGAFHQKNFFETSRYTLAYLGIDGMSKEELLAYLEKGVYNR